MVEQAGQPGLPSGKVLNSYLETFLSILDMCAHDPGPGVGGHRVLEVLFLFLFRKLCSLPFL